jgi:hypothetical protein
MPKQKKRLEKRLESMAEDIQIGGDVNFRSMGCAVVLGEMSGTLTDEHRRHMERLLKRADRLIADLIDFWDDHPELEKMVDTGKVAASEGLNYAHNKLEDDK